MSNKHRPKKSKSTDKIRLKPFTQWLIPLYVLFILISHITTPTSASFHHVTSITGTISAEIKDAEEHAIEVDSDEIEEESEEAIQSQEKKDESFEEYNEDIAEGHEEHGSVVESSEKEHAPKTEEVADDEEAEEEENNTEPSE